MPGGTEVTGQDTPAAVTSLIAAAARARPHATAVVDAYSRLDYATLWARAEAVAEHLRRSLGVGVEDRVGVAATRTASQVVNILGVLLAGAAFVPFDPTEPGGRVRGLLTEAGVRALAGPAALIAATAPELPRLDEAALPAGSPGRLPDPVPVSPQALAYVMFTSGSTGRPKPVGIPAGALATLVAWARSYCGVRTSDVVVQFARITFDACIWEIFTPLCSGAAVAVAAADEVVSPAALEALFARHGVTHADLPAAVWESMRLDRLPRLRFCMTGGEAVAARTVKHCTAPERVVVNGYGLTEATDLSVLGVADPASADPPPIGTAVEGSTAYVVDAQLRLCAPGQTGELYLGGAQLARGYLGHPGLTAERFVPDPWGSRPGDRLYRTGDLVRYLPDGQLEYLGRRDRQVKIRGIRVELGEVELAVNQCTGVREAAITADVHGASPRLVAHVAGPVDAEAIRHQLAARVPAHLIPRTFLAYDRLPRTRNGKVDRAALRRPGAVEPPPPAGRDGVPGAMAGAVHEVLGVWPSAGDRLIDLGADSLDAMRIVARLETAHLAVDVGSVLATPLSEVEYRSHRVEPPPAIAESVPAPLTPAQAGMWYHQRLMPASTVYLVPVRLELTGPLDGERLSGAWDRVVQRHDALRSRIALHGLRACLEADTGPPPLARHDLVDLAEGVREAAVERILRAAQRPFDLTAEAPFRLDLVRISATRHVLGLTAHHILCDGWSLALLARDLGVAYASLGTGAPAGLPSPADRFARYAHQQAADIAGGRYDAGVRFWAGLLTDAAPGTRGPAAGGCPTGRAIGRVFEVDAELSRRLGARCRHMGVTPFVFLLAGFAASLTELAGCHRTVVGVVTANRGRRTDEEIVGQFVNTLPLPVSVGRDGDPGALVAAADRIVRTTRPYWDVPLPLIARALPGLRRAGGIGTGGPWDALFEFDSMPPGRFDAGALTGQLSDEGLQQGAVSELSLRVMARSGQLRGVLVADAGVLTGDELAGIEEDVLRAWRWLAG